MRTIAVCGVTITFFAVISIQLRALEGPERPVMAYAQMIAGAANVQFFIMPGLLWCVAAFRPERPAEVFPGRRRERLVGTL